MPMYIAIVNRVVPIVVNGLQSRVTVIIIVTSDPIIVGAYSFTTEYTPISRPVKYGVDKIASTPTPRGKKPRRQADRQEVGGKKEKKEARFMCAIGDDVSIFPNEKVTSTLKRAKEKNN